MIDLATIKDLKKGEVQPNSCRVLVVKGRIPFGCKKKVDINAKRLYPNEDLMKEFVNEWKKFRQEATGCIVNAHLLKDEKWKLKCLEKAFNLTHFDVRYRRQILADSESISLIRKIKKAHQDIKTYPSGVCIIAEWPDKYPIWLVLESLIKSNIGDQ